MDEAQAHHFLQQFFASLTHSHAGVRSFLIGRLGAGMPTAAHELVGKSPDPQKAEAFSRFLRELADTIDPPSPAAPGSGTGKPQGGHIPTGSGTPSGPPPNTGSGVKPAPAAPVPENRGMGIHSARFEYAVEQAIRNATGFDVRVIDIAEGPPTSSVFRRQMRINYEFTPPTI